MAKLYNNNHKNIKRCCYTTDIYLSAFMQISLSSELKPVTMETEMCSSPV